MKEHIDAHDSRMYPYCRLLGGPTTFKHCRTMGAESLCPRIISCWQNRFDVAGFLVRHYDADYLRELARRPREDKVPKLVRLVERNVARE